MEIKILFYFYIKYVKNNYILIFSYIFNRNNKVTKRKRHLISLYVNKIIILIIIVYNNNLKSE